MYVSTVTSIKFQLEAEQTAANLGVQQYDALLLHGDMDQADRNKVITAFKRQENNILVATDVAGMFIVFIMLVLDRQDFKDSLQSSLICGVTQ